MEFDDVLADTLDQIQNVLASKAEEYATERSRYHNFECAGRKQNCTPEKALLGMMVKHVVAVDDLVDWVELSPEKLNMAMINEKIGDNINYLILLKGMLINRVEVLKNRNMESHPKDQPVLNYTERTITFPPNTTEEERTAYYNRHPFIERPRWTEILLQKGV